MTLVQGYNISLIGYKLKAPQIRTSASKYAKFGIALEYIFVWLVASTLKLCFLHQNIFRDFYCTLQTSLMYFFVFTFLGFWTLMLLPGKGYQCHLWSVITFAGCRYKTRPDWVGWAASHLPQHCFQRWASHLCTLIFIVHTILCQPACCIMCK